MNDKITRYTFDDPVELNKCAFKTIKNAAWIAAFINNLAKKLFAR